MEIMKVFSDYYDDERIYSVLLSEEEVYLFSELQKEFGFNYKNGKMLANGVSKIDKKLARDKFFKNIDHAIVDKSVVGGRKALNKFTRQDPLATSNIRQRFKDYQEFREFYDPKKSAKMAMRNASAMKNLRHY